MKEPIKQKTNMQNTKPILVAALPKALIEIGDEVLQTLLDRTNNEYHVIIYTEHNRTEVELKVLHVNEITQQELQNIVDKSNLSLITFKN